MALQFQGHLNFNTDVGTEKVEKGSKDNLIPAQGDIAYPGKVYYVIRKIYSP